MAVKAVSLMDGRPILIGYDGSPASDAAARWAASTASHLRRPVRLIHAMPWPALRSAAGPTVVANRDLLGRAAERLLDKACRDIRSDHPGLTIEAEVMIGDPVPMLLREATDASLLVLGSRGLGELRDRTEGSVLAHLAVHALGSRGRGRLRGLLLGSVSRSVLHHATCPVAVVR